MSKRERSTVKLYHAVAPCKCSVLGLEQEGINEGHQKVIQTNPLILTNGKLWGGGETKLICLSSWLDFLDFLSVFSVVELLHIHFAIGTFLLYVKLKAYKTAGCLIRNVPSCLQCCDTCCMLHGFVKAELHFHCTH